MVGIHGSYLYHKMPSWGVSEKTFSLRAHKSKCHKLSVIYNGGYPLAKYSAICF